MGKKNQNQATQQVTQYFISIHLGICHGPVEALRAIWIGERIVWNDGMYNSGTFLVNNFNIFGGLAKEGGVLGKVDYMAGDQAQLAPDPLSSRLGLTNLTCPAYRNIASMFMHGDADVDNLVFVESGDILVFLGFTGGGQGFLFQSNNPYLKTIWATVSRPPVGLDPSIAKIYRSSALPWSATFTYHTGDQVSWAGITYASLIDPNLNHEPDLYPADWEPIGTATQWLNFVTYNPGDQVTYLGVAYLSIQASNNQVPSTSPSYWALAPVSPLTPAFTQPSLIVENGLPGNQGWNWDTSGNFAVHSVSASTHFSIWTIPTGAQLDVPAIPQGTWAGGINYTTITGAHITSFNEIIGRSQGAPDGSGVSNFLVYNAPDGTLTQTLSTNVFVNIGLTGVGLCIIDDIVTSAGAFVLCFSNPIIGNFQLTLLQRGTDGKYTTVYNNALANNGTNQCSSLSMGPQSAYATNGNDRHVLLINWQAGTVTDVDLTATLTASIAILHYARDANVVVIVCQNGDMFTFTPTLSAVVNQRTGLGYGVQVDAESSQRLTSGSNKFAVLNATLLSSTQIVYTEFDVNTLGTLRSINATGIYGLAGYTSGQPNFSGFNTTWHMIFVNSHSFFSAFWFYDPLGAYDVNPAHIIYEAMTNTEWGMGVPPTSLDFIAFTAAAETLYAEGLGLSMIWAQQSTIQDFVQEVINHIQATIYINPQNGLVTLRLIRNDYNINNLVTLDQTNCTITSLQKKFWSDTTNEIVVTWTNPDNEQTQTVSWQNPANIAIQGGVVSDSRNYYGVRTASTAINLAIRDLRNVSAPLTIAEIEVDRIAWDFVVGDVFILNDPEHNISSMVMRIGNIDYGKPADSKIKLSVTQDVFSLAETTFVTAQPSTLFASGNEVPRPVDFETIFSAPYFFAKAAAGATTLADPEEVVVVLGAQGGGDTGSFALFGYAPNPSGGQSYGNLGTKTIVPHATLTNAQIIQGQTTLTATDFTGLTEGPSLTAGSFIVIGNGLSQRQELCLVKQVLGGVYTINRGVLDTVPKAWAAGTPVWFVSSITKIEDPVLRSIAESVRYKICPITHLGTLSDSLSPWYNYTVEQRLSLPSRPANVQVNGDGSGFINVSTGPTTPASYVNTGGIQGSVGGTTGTSPLPGSRVNGNLLVAFIQIVVGSETIAIGGGWHIVANATDANQSCAVAVRVVDGTEAACSFTWGTGNTWHCQTNQYTGSDITTIIGNVVINSGNSATLASSGLTSTKNNSVVAAFLLCNGNTAIPTPTGYTNRNSFNDTFASDELADETLVTSGSTSNAISVAITSAPWAAMLIEILGVSSTTLAVTWANRNRLTEDAVVLAWTDSTVTGEASQTTTVEVIDPGSGTALATHSGLSGTSFTVPSSDFGVLQEALIRVSSVIPSSLESLQAFKQRVRIGTIPVEPDIDGSATVTGAAVGAVSASLTTANAGDLIVVVVGWSVNGTTKPDPNLVTITDAGSHTSGWALRAENLFRSKGSVGLETGIDVYTGIAATALAADSITVTMHATCEAICVVMFGLKNVHTASPWDIDPNLPALKSDQSLTSGNPSVQPVSTMQANDIALAIVGSRNGYTYVSPPTGFTNIAHITQAGGSGDLQALEVNYKRLTSVLQPQTVAANSTATTWGIFVDAIKGNE